MSITNPTNFIPPFVASASNSDTLIQINNENRFLFYLSGVAQTDFFYVSIPSDFSKFVIFYNKFSVKGINNVDFIDNYYWLLCSGPT
jgi:hypothetical protein